ncbi:MAG TPA: hypothetical protein VF175_13195 [Lacipirellula sp.]
MDRSVKWLWAVADTRYSTDYVNDQAVAKTQGRASGFTSPESVRRAHH